MTNELGDEELEARNHDTDNEHDDYPAHEEILERVLGSLITEEACDQ